MDSKDVIKSEVVEETQWLLDALGEAAGHQKTRKFLAPFMADYSIRNMGFFGLMGSDKMIELVEGLCNCLQMGENGSNLPSFPIQMGCWSLLNDLRPSAFVARSTSLCDLEYLYVVTRRAEVQPELLEIVARVMAPILKHISEHDDIPLRREIPEEVMRSLEQTGNAQIARYLEAQLPPAMPTTLELAAPKSARIERYEEEQARLEAIKLKERQDVMRARVRYMKEGIPCDLAVHPAEIYSPSRRRRKLFEGKARISRSSKRRAGITRTLGDEEEREALGEAAIAPTNIKPRVTRKRGREETPGPSEVSSPGDVTNTRPRSKRVRFALNVSTVEEPLQPVPHKPSRNTRESDSDASDSPSEGDGSDWDRGGRKSRPAAVRKAILMADHDDQSGKSEDEGPQTRASTSVSKKGMKKSATSGKAKEGQIPSDISKPIEASATRALSPVYGTPQGDLAEPSWILPNLDNGSGEADEGHPRGGSARAQKEVKKRGGISGEDKTPKSLSTKSRPGVHTPLESPVMEPLQKPSRKQHNKRGYESDSSSSDEGDNGDAYDPPQTHRNKKSKVSKRAKHKGSRKIKIKTEKEAPPAGVRAGTVKAKTGPKGRQPRLPIQRDESDISDEGEDDKPRSPLPKVSVPGNESDISDEGDTPKPTSIVALPGPHTPPLLPVPQPPLRRSPRKHHPKRTYESDSSSSDKDDSGDCYVPRASRNTKRTRASEGAGEQDLGQNAPKAEKPQRPPPTQCIKTEPVAKAVAKKAGARSAAAKKAEARSAAAKKAAATRAANHQALVDKITAELEAEAQRAADAGGYQPGAVTKTQLKSRMKREKENIKQEETRERLEAAAARREQSAEAKQIAAAEKQAAAAKKRAATIAAKKVAISEKIQSRSQRTVETKTANANIRDGGGTARGRVAKVKVERAAAESASGRNEESQASTPETVLEGQNVDHGESSRAGEQDAEESDYGAAKKGKRRKRNPKK